MMDDIARVSNTVLFRPTSDPRDKPPAKALRFSLVPFEQIQMSGNATYLVKGLIPRVGLTVIWGPPKCGKSFLVFDMMMRVALGREYRGRRVKQGVVVYCALEGAEGFRARVEAFRREWLSGEEIPPPFYLMASPLSLVADQRAFVEAVRAQLGENKPVVVVIDTLNRSLAGSESDDEAMNAYVRAADTIRDAFDCAVVIVHHCGHGGDRPRGHSLLIGAVETQIAVRRDGAQNIVATLELSKDGPVGAEIVSLLRPVEVGVDEDGDPITSCIIEAAESAQEADRPKSKRRLPESATVALKAFDKAISECGEVAPTSNHIPQGARTITTDRWREYAVRMGISHGEDRAQRKAFQTALERLVAENVVTVWEPYAWRNKSEPPERV